MRSQVDLRVRCIPSWQFNHLDPSRQIERKEMTGMGSTIAMTNHRIGLIGARVAIVQIIPGRTNPTDEQLPQQDESNCQNHADPDANQQQALPPSHWFPGWDITWRSRGRCWLLGVSTRSSRDAWWFLSLRLRPDGTMTQGTLWSK